MKEEEQKPDCIDEEIEKDMDDPFFIEGMHAGLMLDNLDILPEFYSPTPPRIWEPIVVEMGFKVLSYPHRIYVQLRDMEDPIPVDKPKKGLVSDQEVQAFMEDFKERDSKGGLTYKEVVYIFSNYEVLEAVGRYLHPGMILDEDELEARAESSNVVDGVMKEVRCMQQISDEELEEWSQRMLRDGSGLVKEVLKHVKESRIAETHYAKTTSRSIFIRQEWDESKLAELLFNRRSTPVPNKSPLEGEFDKGMLEICKRYIPDR